jgi:HAD superfamily hydrolase (TIGR01450 family)
VKSLAQQHDCLLLDLDGTLFRGHQATEGAVETLAAIDTRQLFVTNNASRSAIEVAEHLTELGFTAAAQDVVTSAQSAARLLADRLPSNARVLVVGTAALADEIVDVGLQPVRSFDDAPVAVVQGHSTATGWSDLAEATLAIRGGAFWVAANVDRTLPTERGLLPGNGSMVAAVRAATDATPVIAGKPAAPLLRDALRRGSFHSPLVVGDRLDTDIAGAHAVGLPSLMVLSGVSTAAEAVHAVPGQRPTYIGADLRSLRTDADELRVEEQSNWRAGMVDGAVVIHSDGDAAPGDELSIVRAVAHAVWQRAGDGQRADVRAGDEAAMAALRRWSLLTGSDQLA